MNSTNRSRARAGKRLAAVVALALLGMCWAAPRAAGAQTPSTADLWFAGTRLVFDHPQILPNGTMSIGNNDSGLARFLGKLNATIAYQPGQKYVVVTSGDRRPIAFAVGDTRYTVAGVAQTAALAPYVVNGVVYLPFFELARALFVDPVSDGGTTVLQPQIAALDARSQNRVTIVTLRGASPLHFKRLSDAGDNRLALAFTGIASTLAPERSIPSTMLKSISIAVSGPPKNPTTLVTFEGAAGSMHALGPSDSPNAVVLAFAPPGSPLGGATVPPDGNATLAFAPLSVSGAPDAPPAPPPPAAAPTPAASLEPVPAGLGAVPATITAVDLQPADAGLIVKLSITGTVGYEWHRLPDDRWYVDFKPATLAAAAQNVRSPAPDVQSLRLKAFVGPRDRLPTVRLALSLASPRAIDIEAVDGGLSVAVQRMDDDGTERAGVGQLQDGRVIAAVTPPPEAPAPEPSPNPVSTWKFNPAAGPNARLIVIDPGHGGSDAGAMHNGLVEKDLNLDVSRRLRAALVARGWLVKMTRDSDVDVYEANDSAHDELQARCDVANRAGARLFISVHTNSFTASSLNGTTTYYYKSGDYALAEAVHVRLAGSLGTKDDGTRKENFYVIRHTTMPAILVETAFLSNAGDAELLKSPAFLQKIALGIADGVGDYAQSTPPVSSASTTNEGL